MLNLANEGLSDEIRTINSKIQVVEPEFDIPLPGQCSNCGWPGPSKSQSARRWVLINLHIDYFGTVFFCELCAKEFGLAVGLLTPEQLLEVTKQLAKQDTEIVQLHLELEQLRNQLDAYRAVINDSGLGSVKPAAVLNAQADEPVGSSPIESVTESGTDKKSDVSKHNPKRREPKNVPDTSGDNSDDIDALLK